MDDAAKLAAVRAGLPSLAAGIQLNTGSLGPLPAETAAAMAEIAEYELARGRADLAYWHETLERIDEARAAVAAAIGAQLDEVAFLHSTTDGMNIAAWSLDWRPGDRVVMTGHEHPAVIGPLATIRDRFGVELHVLDIGDGGDDERTLAALDAALAPHTRLVALSHVLWTTGARLPIERIAALTRARGVVLAVDGAQSAGAMPVNVGATGADFYALAGQKWLLGPEGTGALWVAPDMLERAKRTFAGHHTQARSDALGLWEPQPDARRFMFSGYHRPSIVGLARSIGWLAMYVGFEFVHRRGAALARRTLDALAEVEGVEILTPRHQMSTLVTFRIRGWPAEAAVEELGSRVFAVVRTIALLDAVRASVGFFNSEDELDRFVDAVALLGAHSPETLPPRRTLEIVHGS
jgi:L-cysteine/cystine lyase